MAPIIEITFYDLIFNSFWIKYVNGFNQKYHCQKCLLGSLTEKFKYVKSEIKLNNKYTVYLNEHRTPYIYICGVTNSYEKNLHVPIQPSKDKSFIFENEYLKIEVSNAKQLNIKKLDLNFPPEFSTCRNFQFAYQYFKLKSNEKRLFD
ncbi:hypothetical protein [Mariniphaga sp.]|uniref:hypothetical protein n=1 Tax=Mariniphaga sp. TaxID=1954475 RepID=UPI003562A605